MIAKKMVPFKQLLFRTTGSDYCMSGRLLNIYTTENVVPTVNIQSICALGMSKFTALIWCCWTKHSDFSRQNPRVHCLGHRVFFRWINNKKIKEALKKPFYVLLEFSSMLITWNIVLMYNALDIRNYTLWSKITF